MKSLITWFEICGGNMENVVSLVAVAGRLAWIWYDYCFGYFFVFEFRIYARFFFFNEYNFNSRVLEIENLTAEPLCHIQFFIIFLLALALAFAFIFLRIFSHKNQIVSDIIIYFLTLVLSLFFFAFPFCSIHLRNRPSKLATHLAFQLCVLDGTNCYYYL